MPRTRFKEAPRLILHLVELSIIFNDTMIRIEMVSEDIVADTVTPRPPNDLHIFLPEMIASPLNMRPILQLKGIVMHAPFIAFEKIDGVMIGAAP